MEEKISVPAGTKELLTGKAGTVAETVKEKVTEAKEELLKKANESELAAKAKEKSGKVKKGAQSLVNKVTDKFTGER